MRRLSIAGWGTAAPPVASGETQRSSGEFDTSVNPRGKGKAQMEKVAESMAPLQPQSTGGLWGLWWTSSGGGAGLSKETANSAKSYVNGIRGSKATDTKLVKHLISLRVHLSTAKLDWIEEFLTEGSGMDALGDLLGSLVGKGGKRKKLTDTEGTVLLELIKCLRVLLNTEVSV